MRSAVLMIIALASSAAAVGQQQPIVRVELTPDTVAVGDSAEMRVTVLVPTWFARPPVYPNFELANAITRLPPDSSYPTSERVGNDTWSGIVRNYRVYPLLGATYRLGGQTIRVAYANPGAEPVTLDVEIPEIVFRGSVPPGAEGLDPYIAGSDLSLALDVEGEPKGLEAGDAVVLRYTAELDGLPAIFLPPLAPELNLAGVSIYADQPDVEDGTPARRSETLTLVFEAGGTFEIPGITLDFWNTDTQALDTATAAGVSLVVDGPLPAAATTDATGERDWGRVAVAVVALFVVVHVLRRLMPSLRRRLREMEDRRQQSEGHAFRLLQSALRSGDSAKAYRMLLDWVERLEPCMDARQFSAGFGDATLHDSIDALSSSLHANAEFAVDLRRLGQGLISARRRYLRQVSLAAQGALPPLNP
ncbi:hypothetical protein GWP57_04630 [Gammaproteobacteria bacterium]|nr:hypothetical protein [Gammaproteobacteria bacterium]